MSITTKFIIWFLVIALGPLAVATKISYDRSRDALVEETAAGLLAVADHKAYQIETFLREKKQNATVLAHMSDVVEAVEQLSGSLSTPPAEQDYRPFFTYYQKYFGFENLFLVNRDGDVIFAVKGPRESESLYEQALHGGSPMAGVFVEATESSQTAISGFEVAPGKNQGTLFIGAPVLKESDVIGALILQMSNRGVSALVQDYASLGETGETVLASKVGDEAVFITPARFDANAAFRRRVPAASGEASPGAGVFKAVSGDEGAGMAVDYRGHEVLTVRRYFPAFGWGMVVKMDMAEVTASAGRLRTALYKAGAALLAAVVVMAIVIAHTMSKPIKELTKISGVITAGDTSARARVSTRDEIGTLARAFNEMTDKLVAAKASVEQKKAELEEKHKLLEQANRELDNFTHTVSHDLKTPLRGVASFAEFLDEEYRDKLDDQAKEYLTEIREGTGRMEHLIQDLLALSRISRIQNPFETVDINALVTEVRKRVEFEVTRLKVDLRVQDNMPSIVCDRIKLAEVFLNLITNAIKFSSKQEAAPIVEVKYQETGEFHQFSVKDNGIGIDPKYHDQVFGIFKRLHTADEYEGSGTGLGIVKKVVDDHRGKVWLESEVGQGTTFFFTIPKDLKQGEEQAA